MTLATGTRLGPYEIVGVVGSGGMGEVYRARDDRLGRDVALKVLPESVRCDPGRLRRFEQEARAASALSHPNIVTVYDFDARGDVRYLVAELLEGASLRAMLAERPPSLRRALDWATQIVRGLAAAHDKGIVHRDLKPENLFVTSDGQVKILDFGVAKALASAGDEAVVDGLGTASGVVLGTAGYMSPEQVQGKPVDHRSDLFSFGCIFYEMLSGRRAFDGATAIEKSYAILKDDPPDVSSTARPVPPAVARVMWRCMEKDPRERFQSARDLGFALEALADLSPSTGAGRAWDERGARDELGERDERHEWEEQGERDERDEQAQGDERDEPANVTRDARPLAPRAASGEPAARRPAAARAPSGERAPHRPAAVNVPSAERTALRGSRAAASTAQSEGSGARTRSSAAPHAAPPTAPVATRPPKPARRRILAALALVAALALAYGAGLTAHRPPASRAAAANPSGPRYERITFRREYTGAARFAPDGHGVVYSSIERAGEAPHVYLVSPGNPEPRDITGPGFALFSLSATGEMALCRLKANGGTAALRTEHGCRLARAPLSGGAPRDVLDGVSQADWSPDGQELAVVRAEGARSALDYPIGRVLAESDGRIGSPRISPTGDAVAFVEYPIAGDDRGTIELVGRDGRRSRLSGPWLSIEGLAFSPDGAEVWFAASRSSSLRAIYGVSRARRERLVTELPAMVTLDDVSRDGRTLFTSQHLRASMFAQPRGAAHEVDVSWFRTSFAADLSLDGRRVVFHESEAGHGENVAYFRDLDGSPAVRLGDGVALALSPDGSQVLMWQPPYDGMLTLVPTGPGAPRVLARTHLAQFHAAAFVGDGRQVVVQAHEPGRRPRLWRIDLRDGALRPLTEEGTRLLGHGSPDGTSVLATREGGPVIVVPVDGGAPRPLVELPPRHLPIEWSSDGRSLFVRQLADGYPLHLLRFSLDTKKLEPWRDFTPSDVAGLSFIPTVLMTRDGGAYLYEVRGGTSELYVADGLR